MAWHSTSQPVHAATIRGQCDRVVRVDDAQIGPQHVVRDAGLDVPLQQVEDRHAGRLAACAGGGRDGDQRLEPSGHRLALADRRVDIRQEVRRIGRVQVGGLGRVHHRSAADRDVAIETAVGGEPDRLLERDVGRLDPHAIVQHRIQPLSPQRRQRDRHRFAPCQVRVGDDHHPPRVELAHVVAHLTRGARPELDPG